MDSGTRKAVKTVFIVIALSILALTVYISIPLIRFIRDPELFKAWIDSFGIFSPIVYVLVTIISIIITFVPGEPIELVAGYAFGTFEGTILCMIAESLGSIIVLLLARRFGRKLAEILFDKEKIDQLKFLHRSRFRETMFAVIFIIPGTPKDLLCYFGGMTDIDMRLLMVICTLGRFPSIITSTLLGGNLSAQNYKLAIVTFGVTALLSLAGILLYRRIRFKQDQKKDH